MSPESLRAIMSDNLTTVKALYTAFASGDSAAAASAMSPGVMWHEAENYILADLNPYVGAEAVIAGVFKRTAEMFDEFAFEIEALICDGDTVAMPGRYSAVWKATGTRVNPQVVHWFAVKNGAIAAFQQHVDTFAMVGVLGRWNERRKTNRQSEPRDDTACGEEGGFGLIAVWFRREKAERSEHSHPRKLH